MIARIKKDLSLKLFKALRVLGTRYRDNEILTEINKKLSRPITPGYFSKLRNAWRNKKYISEVSKEIYGKIFQIIDELIFENFSQSWDEALKEYKIIDNAIISNSSKDRLIGLSGIWKIYAWDKIKSKQISEARKQETNYINIFKINISTTENIVCKTENGFFNGAIKLVNNDRAVISLHMKNREAFFVVKIGVNENLSEIKVLNANYCDTGDKAPKAGLAYLIRSSQLFDEIIIETKDLKTFENTTEYDLICKLPNTQVKF